eukprot:12825559-Prorocentrum_lima.AAC.1
MDRCVKQTPTDCFDSAHVEDGRQPGGKVQCFTKNCQDIVIGAPQGCACAHSVTTVQGVFKTPSDALLQVLQ